MSDTAPPIFSLADLIGPELIQQYLGDGMDSILERIVIQNIKQNSPGSYSAYVAIQASNLEPIPLIGDSIFLDLSKDTTPTSRPTPTPSTDQANGLLSIGQITVTTSPTVSISVTMGVGLMFSADLLEPQDGSDAVSIPVGLTISIGSDGITVGPASLTLPACSIGSTGIVVKGGTVYLALWGSSGNPTLTSLGLDSNFRGVAITNLSLTLPSDIDDSNGQLAQNSDKIVFTSATIGNTGFSGKMNATFPQGLAVEFLGADLSLTALSIDIEHNSLAGGSITGTMTLPFFDSPVSVTIAPGDGGWGLSLTGDLVDVTVDGVFDLELTSLGVQRTDGDVWFKISGTLTPELALPSSSNPSIINPSDWPSLSLKDVLIDQNGNIKASGGKMALSSQQTLSIGNVFKAKLTQFGIGTDPNSGAQFISLSGEIDLVAGASLTAKFNDMRIEWNPTGFSLKGLEIDASEAGVFTAQGLVDFIYPSSPSSTSTITPAGISDHGFQGKVKIGIPSAGLTIDASLSVLEVTDTDQNNNTIYYTALFVDLGVQIPGGIPLFSSGLAIQALEGLVGWNYGPTVNDTYSGSWFNWFLGSTSGAVTPTTIGATPLAVGGQTKWEPQYDTKAFGVGVTLGTLPDVGFSWHSAIVFVVVLPGPDLILAGSCNFISKPSGLTDSSSYSGAFSVLIVYDGNAETLDAMIAANVGQDPILTASGAATAFFDFKDPGAWYLDIGTEQKPLQASALKIFTATAYFDLDKQELQFGASAGFNQSYAFGPLSASAKLTAGLTAVVIFKPAYLSADAQLNGAIALSAFGVGVNVSLYASVALDLRAETSNVSASFNVQAELNVELGINLIFTKIQLGGTIELDVSSPGYASPNPPPYPLDSITIQHALVQNTWPLLLSPLPTIDGIAGGQPVSQPSPLPLPPVVPPDCLPTITFSVPMNDSTGVNQNIPSSLSAPNNDQGYIQYGNAQYMFTLSGVTIEQLDANFNSLNPQVLVSGVRGKWSIINNTYTLQIWADTPSSASSLSMALPSNRLADQQAILGPAPCSPISYTPETICVPMADSDEVHLGFSYSAVPPNDGFDQIRLNTSWRLAQDLAVRVRQIWFCPQDSIQFSQLVNKITIQEGTWSEQSDAEAAAAPPLLGTFCQTSQEPIMLSAAGKRRGLFEALDSNGNRVPFTTTTAGTNVHHIECPQGASAIRVLRAIPILRICYVTQQEVQNQQAASEANAAKQAALQSGATATSNPLLLPWTNYKITVTTQVQGKQNGQSMSSIPQVTNGSFTDTTTFTTSGPPGFPDQPTGTTDTSALNVLADLTRYLAASVPLGDAARLASGRYESAYCGYDLTMFFNQGYVPDLYTNAPTLLPNAALELNAIELNSVGESPDGSVCNYSLTQSGSFCDKSGSAILVKGETIAATTNQLNIPAHTSPSRTLWATQLASCGLQQQYPPDAAVTLPMNQHAGLAPRNRYSLVATAGSGPNASWPALWPSWPAIVASVDLTTSRFLTVTHQLQSLPDTVFTMQGPDAGLNGVAANYQAMSSSISSAEAAAFDSAWTALENPQIPPVETLDVTAIQDQQSNVIGLLFVSPEPIPWDRVSWNAEFASIPVQPLRPSAAKINDVYDGGPPSYIDIMLLQDADPAGWTLSANSPSQETPTQLFVFGENGIFPSGTIFRIFYSGSSNAPADIVTDTLTQPLPSGTTSITLTDQNSNVLHTRTFVEESLYDAASSALTLNVIRKADGTMFLVQNTASGNTTPFPNSGGDLRLTVTVLRDVGDPNRVWRRCGDSSPESTNLHIAIPPTTMLPKPIGPIKSR